MWNELMVAISEVLMLNYPAPVSVSGNENRPFGGSGPTSVSEGIKMQMRGPATT